MTPFLLYDHVQDDDTLSRISLRVDEDGSLVLLVSPDARAEVPPEELPLPEGALGAVMRRYGKPLEESERPALDETLDLGDGRSLARFRFMARFDIIRRDWLLYREPGSEPLCEMATAVTAALEHLARRANAAASAPAGEP